jgi:hypothetical protein
MSSAKRRRYLSACITAALWGGLRLPLWRNGLRQALDISGNRPATSTADGNHLCSSAPRTQFCYDTQPTTTSELKLQRRHKRPFFGHKRRLITHLHEIPNAVDVGINIAKRERERRSFACAIILTDRCINSRWRNAPDLFFLLFTDKELDSKLWLRVAELSMYSARPR